MSDFRVIDGCIGSQAIDFNEPDEALAHGYGRCLKARDADSISSTGTDYGDAEFIYLKGVASTVVGSVVTFDQDDYTTKLADADDVGPIAIAMSACVAGESGWYQIYGKAVVKVLAGFADGAVPYLTSTSGSLDDAVVAGDAVHNSTGASAIGTPSAGLAELSISYPHVNNGLT